MTALLLLTHEARLTTAVAQMAQKPRILRVAVAVADLRREPSEPSPTLEYDPLEESQLLYGDPVELIEVMSEKEPAALLSAQDLGLAERKAKVRGWAKVAAVEQEEWNHHMRWEGYPGWINLAHLTLDPGNWNPNLVVSAKLGKVRVKPAANARVRLTLSLGTRLVGIAQVTLKGAWHHARHQKWWQLQLLDGTPGWISEEEVTQLENFSKEDLRKRIVQTTRLFLGDPYYWGGRSSYNPQAVGPSHRAVDCSGLVGLAYQAGGIRIPRDAHEQWMKAKPISSAQLAAGDLIFLANPAEPDRVSHVMLYIGEGRIIEGPGTGSKVREMDLIDRLKETEGTHRVLYGRYLE